MMPQLVIVRTRTREGRRLRLWLPVPVLLLVLVPLLPLALVVFAVASLANHVSPGGALGAAWRLLWSLSGTRIDVGHDGTDVFIEVLPRLTKGREDVMSDQRRQILQMLADGKVTADEAEQLIAALEQEQSVTATPAGDGRPKARPKYLRVIVNLPDSFGGNGPGRVNIRVPLQLLRAGVKIASLIPPQALEQVNKELHKSGVPVDLSQLKPDHVEDLIDALDDVTVDVDQPEAKVQVFCE